MPKPPSRRLVIDASIAARAGDRKKLHPAGQACRDFLEAVLTICHRMVLTSAIGKEWSDHQRSFATKWRVRMYARSLFARACGHVAELERIVWVNPERPEETPMLWLERGAKPEAKRTLARTG
jgi:hypothetical protein